MHFPKYKPSILTYRSYKKFDNKKFMENLNAEIITQSNYIEKDGIDAFSAICCEVLNNHAPQKQQFLRGNHKPFINAEISKAIMIRSSDTEVMKTDAYFRNKEISVYHFCEKLKRNISHH